MKYQTILFDLDGTLLPLSNDVFEKLYIGTLAQKVAPYIEPKEMVSSLWKATAAMVASKENLTNEEVFYKAFGGLVGEDKLAELIPVFNDYYDNEFDALKEKIEENDIMIEAIQLLKQAGYQLIIATNPMFPEAAINKRIKWAGLNREDFSFVTYFERQHYCKPNVEYFEEIVSMNQLDPTKCLMVGNDMQEDMIARSLGMDGWILNEHLIDRGGEETCEWIGTREEFLERVKEYLL